MILFGKFLLLMAQTVEHVFAVHSSIIFQKQARQLL